jgi:hypothetical protein
MVHLAEDDAALADRVAQVFEATGRDPEKAGDACY